ncbi:CGNR zinc finger domain-containing protein [Rathayibacter sp. YIM 133350]|uniref:CGNR zinc finger domain-containing protein n=1 Tax=Rathayibacter sp. YIM 133350 TaxID=3131992 RepID=UPI00307D7AE0
MTDGGNVPERGANGPSERAQELMIAFLNSVDIEEGTDEITTPTELEAWARARGLTGGDLGQVRELRGALRSLASGEPVESPAASVPIRLTGGTVQAQASTVCEAVLASAFTLSIEGRLGRIRLCRAEDCAYAFYDRSRNGSRAWCDMGLCGNRAKARSYRERRP